MKHKKNHSEASKMLAMCQMYNFEFQKSVLTEAKK